MGVVNVTPDSFSDGGEFLDPEKAFRHALALVEEGADLVDVGGESTRPGAQPVSAEVELKRVLPVIERLAGRVQVPISMDTSKAAVARAAVAAGASLINDVTALRDPGMAQAAAEAEVPIILMHLRGTPQTMQSQCRYDRLIPEILEELKPAIDQARQAGIAEDRILIDPGIGFGKTPEQNLALIKNLKELKALGFPLVVGPSRKSFIGQVLDLPVGERLMGTAAAVALCAANGADIIRVHDVAAMRQVVRMTEAILKS
ncbi:MAG: dihydropteroate synthase [Candidatus Omnitrophica bacterium]|nr:dihydropteroate synthase [Candidatus Omnitrophota bacterium]